MLTKTIYLAGAWPERLRIRERAEQLRALGHHVISDWHDATADGQDYDTLDVDQMAQIGLTNMALLRHADMLILDTEGESRGGRDFEAGFFAGIILKTRKVITVVGPPTNPFTYYLIKLQRDDGDPFEPSTWDEVLAVLEPTIPAHS